MRRLCLWAFVLLSLCGSARAHEAAMGVLELHQVKPTEFIGNWTLAPTFDPKYLRAQFPPQCHWEPPLLECGSPGFVGRVAFDNLGGNMSAVMLRVFPMEGEPRTYTLSAATPAVTVLGESKPTLATWIELAMTYLNLGIDHILLGVDHLLFVLGLIWIVQGGWRLAKTITAFTVGHSLSLAAAAFGLIGVPERPLNAVIALSIVVRRRRDRATPPRRGRRHRALSMGGGAGVRAGARHRVRRRAGVARHPKERFARSIVVVQCRGGGRAVGLRAARSGAVLGAPHAHGDIAALGRGPAGVRDRRAGDVLVHRPHGAAGHDIGGDPSRPVKKGE